MSWETLAVVSGEIQSPSEARQNQLGHDFDYGVRDSADDVHTGVGAMYNIGPGDGLGVNLAGTGWTSVRAGYWYKSFGWWHNTGHRFFYGCGPNFDDQTDFQFKIALAWTSYQIQLLSVNNEDRTEAVVAYTGDTTALFGGINDWKHISLYMNRATHSIKFRVNGVLLIESLGFSFFNNVNTLYAAASGNLANAGGYGFVDDLYFDYSTLSEADDPPPARRFYPVKPNAAGTYTQWSPVSGSNYEQVDDPEEPDDDVSTITSSNNGEKDTYNFPDLVDIPPGSAPTGAIVQAYCRVNPVDGGIGKIRFLSLYAATEVATAFQRVRQQQKSNWTYSINRDWTVLTGFFDVQPGGGGEWSEAAFNGAEFGVESGGIV